MLTIENTKMAFWVELMEMLNTGKDLCQSIPEILRKLCDFFEFGCGFVYEADYSSLFFLEAQHSVYAAANLQDRLDLGSELGLQLMEELAQKKLVFFRENMPKTSLNEKLSVLFSARSMMLVPVPDEAGKIVALVGIMDRRGYARMEEEDLTFTHAILCTLANHIKLKLCRRKANATRRSLENILDNTGVDIYVNDFYTREILYTNRSMAAPYGGPENMLGKICWQVLYNNRTGPCEYCPQQKLIDAQGQPTKVFSWDYQRPFDSRWFRVVSAAFRWVDGRLAHVITSMDITENKQNEEIIRQIAYYDRLTSLPNLHKLTLDCVEHLAEAESFCTEGYLLFLDLDDFKQINDSLGHLAGDELLARISELLQANPLTQGRCYRYGGDEFVIFCNRYTFSEILAVIRFLQQTFSAPWALESGAVFCHSSIGVSHYPQDASTLTDLLRAADLAMYESKRKGFGLAHFYNQGAPCTSEEYAVTHLPRD